MKKFGDDGMFLQMKITLLTCQNKNSSATLEKNHTCLLTLTSTNNGSWHRVRLLHGGIGKIPGGLLKIQKVKEEASKVLRI